MRQEVRWWLDDAANDLAAAEDLYRAGRWNLTVFLARQAVEKTLKAAHLHLLRQPSPREHNLVELMRLLPLHSPADVGADLTWLNPHLHGDPLRRRRRRAAHGHLPAGTGR